jgi:L-fucose isomerase-like protein
VTKEPSQTAARPAAQPANNIGVLIFGRKRPGFDQDWNAEVRERCRDSLSQLGFGLIGADRLVLDDGSVNIALDEMEQAHCQALIVIQPSLADGQFALTVSQRWPDPVVLWATPERPGDGKVSSCSLVGQHLWASIFRQANHAFEFVYGAPEDVHDQLQKAINLAAAIGKLRTAKLGMVGGHAPGFIDLAADPFLIRKTFGLQLQPLSLPQFIERVRDVPEADVHADLDRVRALGLRQTADRTAAPDDLLSVNSRYYLAMLDVMREFSLEALSIQCWPELPNMLGQWPYLAVSRLSAEGHAISIEGDVDGAILALTGRLTGIGPGFLSDWLEHDADTIFFWHPGMAPLDMCNAMGCADEPSIGGHFNGARPFVVDGPLKVGGPVTVSRLWRCDGRYHATAFEGEAIPPRRRVTGNSLLVAVDGGGVPDRFEDLIHAGLPHHVTIHFGRHAAMLRRLARIIGAQWHEEAEGR